MRLRIYIFASLMLVLLALFSQTDSPNREMVLNPNGWNVPEVTKMVLEKVEAITLPGIPNELVAEYWMHGADPSYRITNLLPWRPKPSAPNILYNEKVARLTIYKTSSGRILCFEYARILEDRSKKLPIGGLTTLISDLDENGKYEFQMSNGNEAGDRKLLISLIRIKLGLSEETDLVRRIVRSATREMSNNK